MFINSSLYRPFLNYTLHHPVLKNPYSSRALVEATPPCNFSPIHSKPLVNPKHLESIKEAFKSLDECLLKLASDHSFLNAFAMTHRIYVERS